MSFDGLPLELQNSIIRLLDPIGLMSVSQANSHFRRLINPRKEHRAERLLALEMQPEYGGVTLVYHSRTNTLTPKQGSEQWKAMRWACTDCLRLLPHQNFDNHSILGLGYRKPMPGSPAAGLSTSWEPSLLGKHWKAYSKRRYRPAERSHRRCYLVATTWSRSSPPGHIPVLLSNDEAEWYEKLTYSASGSLSPVQMMKRLDDYALEYEKDRCGYNRRIRKCNECRFRRGQLKPRFQRWERASVGGTARTPLVSSRLMNFGCALDRYFPDISSVLQNKRPAFDPPLVRVYRNQARGEDWALRMMRCSQCSRWQEMRAFRVCGTHRGWRLGIGRDESDTWDEKLVTQGYVNSLRCNGCFAETHGREELGAALLKWITWLMDCEMEAQTQRLLFGFHRLRNLIHHQPPQSKKRRSEWKKTLMDAVATERRGQISYAEISIMKGCHRKVVGFLQDCSEEQREEWSIDDDDWFNTWLLYFDETAEFWRWVRMCKDEVEEKPHVLVEWALGRDADALD